MRVPLTKSGSICVLLLSLILTFSIITFGQEGLSTLRGTATDTSGAVVPGVSVVAREILTNIVVRTVVTDAQGNYEMPALKSGTYQVTATLSGFKKSVVDSIRIYRSPEMPSPARMRFWPFCPTSRENRVTGERLDSPDKAAPRSTWVRMA